MPTPPPAQVCLATWANLGIIPPTFWGSHPHETAGSSPLSHLTPVYDPSLHFLLKRGKTMTPCFLICISQVFFSFIKVQFGEL